MTIDWPLIIVLFGICIPGTLIAIKRLIYFLLPDNSEALRKRISSFAILQTLILVFILSLSGAVLSRITGLRAPILESMVHGTANASAILPILLPAAAYALLGLLAFCGLYYGVVKRVVDEKSLLIMTRLRMSLGIDGCVLYGGVVEEVIARWGIMNLATFFAVIFMKHPTSLIMWFTIVISGLIFAMGQLPAYFAAGCISSRNFIYSYTLLSLSQSVVFGYLFWKYGLLCAILSHMLFHLGWALLDVILNKNPQKTI